MLIASAFGLPSAEAATKAALSLDLPERVTVGDTAVAQIKVTNGGDTTFGLSAIRVVLACKTLGPGTTCDTGESEEVFQVKSAQAAGSACDTKVFRATRTAKNRLLIEPISDLGGPVLAVPLKQGEACAIDLSLAVRVVPADDADGDPGAQTKLAALAVIQSLAGTSLPALAPDDSATVTVDPPAEPIEVEPIEEEPVETPPVAEEAPAVTCEGIKATKVGTGAGDTITGTPGRDIIAGLGGGDIIDGGGGKDVICGGTGVDTLRGGTGRDVLAGGSGNDALNGGAGNDILKGSAGNDRLNGAAGADDLRGGSGNDKLVGGTGEDRLNGGPGKDKLNGGQGRDAGNGGSGADTFTSVERQRG